MTELREEVREGSPPETTAPDASAESAQRAKSITRTDAVALDAVTQSAFWVRARVAQLLIRLFARPESQSGYRPTFPGARDWHHKCADYYAGFPPARWLRLVYGYAHLLLIKSVIDFTEWLTESPARFFTAVAVVAALWFGGLVSWL